MSEISVPETRFDRQTQTHHSFVPVEAADCANVEISDGLVVSPAVAWIS